MLGGLRRSLARLRRLGRPTVQHVRKAAMQPGLTRRIVVPRVDGFVVDVRIVAAEASDLLDQSGVSVGHELLVTPTP